MNLSVTAAAAETSFQRNEIVGVCGEKSRKQRHLNLLSVLSAAEDKLREREEIVTYSLFLGISAECIFFPKKQNSIVNMVGLSLGAVQWSAARALRCSAVARRSRLYCSM